MRFYTVGFALEPFYSVWLCSARLRAVELHAVGFRAAERRPTTDQNAVFVLAGV